MEEAGAPSNVRTPMQACKTHKIPEKYGNRQNKEESSSDQSQRYGGLQIAWHIVSQKVIREPR